LLTVAGLHVPVIPLVEVAGNVTTEAPAQIVVLVPKEKVGVILGFTVTSKVVPNTHPGPVAVKTYLPDVVLSIVAGDQVPLTPLADVAGNAGGVAFLHKVRDVPNEKVAVLFGVTVMVSGRGIPQVPAAGVKVYVPEF
jgi:hypothetical protein